MQRRKRDATTIKNQYRKRGEENVNEMNERGQTEQKVENRRKNKRMTQRDEKKRQKINMKVKKKKCTETNKRRNK